MIAMPPIAPFQGFQFRLKFSTCLTIGRTCPPLFTSIVLFLRNWKEWEMMRAYRKPTGHPCYWLLSIRGVHWSLRLLHLALKIVTNSIRNMCRQPLLTSTMPSKAQNHLLTENHVDEEFLKPNEDPETQIQSITTISPNMDMSRIGFRH